MGKGDTGLELNSPCGVPDSFWRAVETKSQLGAGGTKGRLTSHVKLPLRIEDRKAPSTRLATERCVCVCVCLVHWTLFR